MEELQRAAGRQVSEMLHLPTWQGHPIQHIWQQKQYFAGVFGTAINAGNNAASVAQDYSVAVTAARRRTIGADTHTQHIISHLQGSCFADGQLARLARLLL